jgi:hypothetical protein
MAKPPVSVTLTFDPLDMARRGRIGAYVLHSRHDSRETTRAGRAAFLSRFEREVDPDGVLPAAERQRRAEMARRAHFARLALKSARARARRASPTTQQTAAESQSAAEEVRDVAAQPSD